MAASKKTTTKKTTKKKSSSVSDKIAINEDEVEEEIEVPLTEGSVMGMRDFFIRPEFNAKKMIKNIKKRFPFINAEMVNNSVFISGLANGRSQFIFVNDQFINICLDLIMTIKNNEEHYKIDGKLVTVYELMNIFANEEPKGVDRYKGLGEMDPKQLNETVMNQIGNRSLIRYTIESAKQEIENIRHIKSNMYSLLRDIRVSRDEIE